jgi:sugar/nucleoside kinase (ribokinase family)
LVLNKEEAFYLVGKRKIWRALRRLLKLGPQLVVITDGPNEVFASEGKYMYYLKPHRVKVIEATGAGDAFASACLAGIIESGDIESALKWGLANSQSIVTHYGPKEGLLSYKELTEKIKDMKVGKEKL